MVLKQDRHDDKKRLAEVRRTAFAAGLAVRNLVAGIVLDRVGSRKTNQRLLVREAARVTCKRRSLDVFDAVRSALALNGYLLPE